jgi:hypothetical protein
MGRNPQKMADFSGFCLQRRLKVVVYPILIGDVCRGEFPLPSEMS